jgi:hypothetical protein
MGGSCWADIKAYLTATLILIGSKVLENRKLIDKPKGKGAKVIGTAFRSGHNQELFIRV